MLNNKNFEELTKDYIDWKMKHNPTISTMFGYKEYNNLLEDMSAEAIEQHLKDLKGFQKGAEEMPAGDDSDSQIDLSLLKRDIDGQIRDIEKFKSHILNPTVYPDLALHSIYLLSNSSSVSPDEKIDCILQRMEKIPSLLEDGVNNLQKPPLVHLNMALNSCHGGKLFINQLVSALEKERPSFSKDLNKRKQAVMEAFDKFSSFLKEDMVKKSNGNFAIGKELFDELLKDDYMLDYDSEKVLSIGEEIFHKAHKELEEISEKIDRNKNWKDLYYNLRLKHPEPEKIIETYNYYMEKAKKFVIDRDLVDLPPDESVEVRPSPEFLRPIMPTAAYNPPAVLDDFKKGIFMVTPVDTTGNPEAVKAHLMDHNLAEIVTTTLHEAYPGHHLQLTYASLHPGLMRRHVFTPIFAEGWALYCEQLMKDYGYLEDPLIEISFLRRVLWRSLRVIIDVSLHTKGMSVDEAVSRMVSELLFSEGSARGEVMRYTMTPTQPLSYLIGKLEILKLRDEYEKLGGKNYTIKKFHQDLLTCGTLPIRLLRKAMIEKGKRVK